VAKLLTVPIEVALASISKEVPKASLTEAEDSRLDEGADRWRLEVDLL